jgi:hypothetical protein
VYRNLPDPQGSFLVAGAARVSHWIDGYDSVAEALTDVRATLAVYGHEIVRAWTLMRHEGETVETIAADALIERDRASGIGT